MSENEKAHEAAIESALKTIKDGLQSRLKELFTKKNQPFDFDTSDSVEEIEEIFTGVIVDELFDFAIIDNAPENADLREQHLFANPVINGEPKSLVIKYGVNVDNLKFIYYFESLSIKDAGTAYA
ncbi:MAG: hypothetical protein WC526_03565 [Patescibacteria group bacterium]